MADIVFTKVTLPYGWLGNMAPYPIAIHDRVWLTSEALFQARRFAENDPIRERIRAEKSPMSAKMIAKSQRAAMVIVPQSDEDLALMADVLRLKVEAHPELRKAILDTGDARIIEDCSRRARGSGLFWGAALQPDGSWKGENKLGVLWEALRTTLKGRL
jgi:ribA/ribD-fused uncharacterized protein